MFLVFKHYLAIPMLIWLWPTYGWVRFQLWQL